jgi:ADP-heptose:LPS heptosyltransferase/GT2 family glycosyltransferase
MTRKRPPPEKRAKALRGEGGAGTMPAPAGRTDQLPIPPVADEIGAMGDEPVVVIEIDPMLSGGPTANRFDVMISGRVVSVVPIKEIRLQVEDWVTGTSSFDQPERAAACVMPDGRPGRQRIFQFNLPRPRGVELERCTFRIVACTAGDREYAENFEIEVASAGAGSVALISGKISSSMTADHGLPDALMYFERGAIDDDGFLSVEGWTLSFGRVKAVLISVDGTPIAPALIGGKRHDVAAAFPAYPNAAISGFSLLVQLDEALRTAERVRAEAIYSNNVGRGESIPVERLRWRGSAALPAKGDAPIDSAAVARFDPAVSRNAVAGSPLNTPAPIEMYCDAAELTDGGSLSLSGWAVCASGIGQVRVLLDDEEVGLATSGHERKDVGSLYGAIRMAHLSGFRFERDLGRSYQGEHEVRILVCGAQGGVGERRVAVVATAVTATRVAVVLPTGKRRTGVVASAEQAEEFRFELDSPALLNGAMVDPVTGRMTIEGWLLTRSGIADFKIFLDDQLLGDAHYGLARQDVGSAFPEWPNALRSGFAFHCPPRSLRDGEHSVRLAIRANNGVELDRSFRIVVRKSDDQEEAVAIRRRIPRVEADMMLAFLARSDHPPEFRFVLRQRGPIDVARWRATLDALRLQAYADWTAVVLAEDDDGAAAIGRIVDDVVPRWADRFSVRCPSTVEAWEVPLVRAVDDRSVLLALLLPGDEPGADAMLEFAVASFLNPAADLLYGDEVRISPVSQEREPFFKPDFSPDLLLSTNYIGRLWVATADLLAKVGVTAAGLVSAGEYDLLLRCVEQARGVHHVPKLLCQRAAVELDDPALERAALERMLCRRGMAAEVLATPITGVWRIKRAVRSKGKVSIIIPTCAANGYIEACINTLRAKTCYPDFEIICIDSIPSSDIAWKIWLKANSDKVIEMPDAFNWSLFNNRATEVAEGDYFLFLNDDIEIVQDDWLDALVEHAQRPEVGVVGPRLLYPDGTVQHAGMFLSSNGIGRHAFRFAAKDDAGYFGLALTQRNVIAVTGACMLVRRETFQGVGRFDNAHKIVNNDLDFCLRAHRAGLLTVFTPYATLIHHELASRASMKDVYDLTHFDAVWKTTFAAGDPYFNPRLSMQAEDYRPDEEPVQRAVSGAPMFSVAEIERILVVKLDHIGDFVTALPPIRRLRRIFPKARISVLASPASRGFVSFESNIDEFIPFSFFHTRSQLGELELTKDDYAALARQLGPYRFDLAVDLRKHPATRDVLKYTGARFLAGFDYLGQFPFLDIALDWDGDRKMQRKRSHISDDLLILVDAIGHATENDRLLMQPNPPAMPLTELPTEVRALFGRPVVAMHPGAGNITKQWPEAKFSALIELLIVKNNVNVLLLGGPDDVALGDRLVGSVLHKGAIGSMAGKTSLADLPRLLRNCVLFIGNDSGPKHVAAAAGIPTIGIHSGVVDPVEWGPIGPSAVAIRRNMTCSPCYLANAEDCPRSLACLKFLEPSLVYETADMMLKSAGQGTGPMEPEGPDPIIEASRRRAKAARKPKVNRRQPIAEPA